MDDGHRSTILWTPTCVGVTVVSGSNGGGGMVAGSVFEKQKRRHPGTERGRPPLSE